MNEPSCSTGPGTDQSPSGVPLATSDGWYRLDAAWRFVDANPRFEELSGHTRADMLGRMFRDVFPDSRPLDVEELAAQSAQEHRPIRRETYLPALRCWVEAIFISDGNGLEAFFRDVDDRSRAGMATQLSETQFRILSQGLRRNQIELESQVADRTRELAVAATQLSREITEREAVQAQLAHSQKLESIGRLTGGVAHDFNNLLQVVSANLDLLRPMAAAAGETALRRHRAALDGVQRGATLTRSLLAFARKQPLEPKVLDTAAMLADAAELLRHALGTTIVVETCTPAGLWNVCADRLQLQNALLNVGVNARDAMAGGGRLVLAATNARLDGDEAAAGEYVCIAVTDTGTGMPPGLLEHVFEPFFTTKEDSKGTGLGLAQVDSFMRQSAGHARIKSQLGEGTTVSLYFPRSHAEVAAAPAAALLDAPVPDTIGGNETILVVEDDLHVRKGVADLLESLGYQTQLAANTTAALALLHAWTPIDLIVADIVMPGPLSSVELVRQMHAVRPGIPVLFTPGYMEDAIAHDGQPEYGLHLLSKPYSRDDLARKLRVLLHPVPASLQVPASVLVVEDDELIRMNVVVQLEDLGRTVREAADGRAALAALMADPTISIMIADLGLPDMDGAALIARARELRPGLRVIVATGRLAKDAIEGAVPLQKPYGSEDLRRALEAC